VDVDEEREEGGRYSGAGIVDELASERRGRETLYGKSSL
jgi:hypothetical protein